MNQLMEAAASRRMTALLDENDLLREENRQLREALVPPDIAPMREWRLTVLETRIYRHLASREVATREGLMMVLYLDRPDDPPDQKVLDVHIFKIRRKLEPHGISIQAVFGLGYRLEKNNG